MRFCVSCCFQFKKKKKKQAKHHVINASNVQQLFNLHMLWVCIAFLVRFKGKSNLLIRLERTAITQPLSVMPGITIQKNKTKQKNTIIYIEYFIWTQRVRARSTLQRHYECALWGRMSLDRWRLQLQWSFIWENISVWGNHIQHWWLLIDLEALCSVRFNRHCQTDPGTITHSFRHSPKK